MSRGLPSKCCDKPRGITPKGCGITNPVTRSELTKSPKRSDKPLVRDHSRHPCNKDHHGDAKRQFQLSASKAVVGDRGLIVFA